MIISFKWSLTSTTQKLAYAVALGALAASTAGCDKLSNQTALSSITGTPADVPSEIANLCMSYSRHTVSDFFAEMPSHFSLKDVKWEQNGANHIWRATMYNVLEQRDIPVSVQFGTDTMPTNANFACGTTALALENGLVDGQYIEWRDFNQMVRPVMDALDQRNPLPDPIPSPPPEPTPYIDNSVVDNSSADSVASNEAFDNGADESTPDTGSNATNGY